MKKLIVLSVLAFAVVGCSDPDTAQRTLENTTDLTAIKITGYRWTGCGQDDSYHTGFEAMNNKGVPVSGVVCSGWGWFSKGATIRYD